MALSPWHVASHLHCHDVASLLADDIPDEYEEWRRAIFNAAHLGELKPYRVMEHAPKPGIKLRGEELMLSDCSWQPRDVDDTSWHLALADRVQLTFERQEIYRWLKSTGATDGDIPEALRAKHANAMERAQQQDRPLHARRRHTYLTLIEALALEAMDGVIPDQPYKAAITLQAILERRGLKLDKDPIADTIKEIQAIREDRATEGS
ncbi:hypothetical protein ACFFU2_10565 [Halomonas alkalicola]|uniref:Uncharacterized protein n=1 Tax=Halomonas alkalicola TaxID=1930622 RepID=A0ABY9H674_9GAMM|nr:hypothetical protein [Halomonas alkalicola]WLI73617.1 hypothetical protein B6N23_01355 [Halomonas alkalicola]